MPNGRDPKGSKRIQLVVTEQERQRIKLEAVKEGMSIKEFIFCKLNIPYRDGRLKTQK